MRVGGFLYGFDVPDGCALEEFIIKGNSPCVSSTIFEVWDKARKYDTNQLEIGVFSTPEAVEIGVMLLAIGELGPRSINQLCKEVSCLVAHTQLLEQATSVGQKRVKNASKRRRYYDSYKAFTEAKRFHDMTDIEAFETAGEKVFKSSDTVKRDISFVKRNIINKE